MSGLYSQFGIVDESTYGTAVAVSKFLEFNNESIAGDYQRIDSQAVRLNTRYLRADRFAVNPKGAGGGVEFDVLSKNFAYLLKHLLGSVAAPVAGTGSDVGAYSHVGTPAALSGKSFTVQVGRPQTGGTVTPFTYSGGKVKSWELSNSVDGFLVAKLDMDFQAEASSGAGAFALQAASYPTGTEVLNFVGGSVNIGGSAVSNKALTTNVATITTAAAHGLAVGQPVTVAGVDATFDGTYIVASVPTGTTFTYAKTASNVSTTAATGTVIGGVNTNAVSVTNASVTSDNGLKTDRYFIRSSTLKKEPLEGAARTGAVSLDMEFDSLTQYNRVASATAAGALAAVELRWAGSLVVAGGTIQNSVTVHLPAVRMDTFPPQVAGYDLLHATLAGVILDPALASGLGPIAITVQSGEATP